MAEPRRGSMGPLTYGSVTGTVTPVGIAVASYNLHLPYDWRWVSAIASAGCAVLALVVLLVLVIIFHARNTKNAMDFLMEPVKSIGSPWLQALGVYCIYLTVAALVFMIATVL